MNLISFPPDSPELISSAHFSVPATTMAFSELFKTPADYQSGSSGNQEFPLFVPYTRFGNMVPTISTATNFTDPNP